MHLHLTLPSSLCCTCELEVYRACTFRFVPFSSSLVFRDYGGLSCSCMLVPPVDSWASKCLIVLYPHGDVASHRRAPTGSGCRQSFRRGDMPPSLPSSRLFCLSCSVELAHVNWNADNIRPRLTHRRAPRARIFFCCLPFACRSLLRSNVMFSGQGFATWRDRRWPIAGLSGARTAVSGLSFFSRVSRFIPQTCPIQKVLLCPVGVRCFRLFLFGEPC